MKCLRTLLDVILAPRGARRALGLLLVIISAGVGLAPPAAAHNTLIGSTPVDGSTVQTAPTTVTVTFDQPVVNYQPAMTVTGPNGNRFSVGDPVVRGSVVSIGVSAGPAGRYAAAYRVVSADGHPVYGQIGYTVASGGAGTATGSAPTASAATAASPDAAQGSSGLAWWLWAGIGVAVLMVAAAVVVILRPSRAPGVDQDRPARPWHWHRYRHRHRRRVPAPPGG